jgi:hypothetical protein
MKKQKVVLTQEQKSLQKIKRFVQKRFPGAKVVGKLVNEQLQYSIVDGKGLTVIDPELMIPPAKSVTQAWNNAKYVAWFTSMIQKSNAAFDEEKIFKKLAKEHGDD